MCYQKDDSLVDKLFTNLGPRYEGRPGGYSRVLKLERRKSDNALMAVLEYVDNPLGNLISPGKQRKLQKSENVKNKEEKE